MSLISKLFSSNSKKPGSVDWLIATEQKYGGYHTNVKRNKVSSKDHRPDEEIKKGGMTGGDRMHPDNHGYSKKYAEYLSKFLSEGQTPVVAEIGILKGLGLALWCDLFPNGTVYGFDIDLGHTKGNMDSLIQLGAFQSNKPDLHEFDQLVQNASLLKSILGSKKFDIVVDDGLHTDESIMLTVESVYPHMNEGAVIFIEDNKTVHKILKEKYKHLKVDSEGEFTVLAGF